MPNLDGNPASPNPGDSVLGASYIVDGSGIGEAQLTNRRILTAGTNITLTDNGPAGTLVIASTAFATGDIEEVIAGAGLTGGGASGSVTLDVAAADATIAVTANAIAVGVITNANLADNTIALARIANGTAGHVPYYGPGGVLTASASLFFDFSQGRLSPGDSTTGYFTSNSGFGARLAWGSVLFTLNTVNAVVTGGRFVVTKLADIASAASIAIDGGNSATVTGTTTLNTIAATNWVAGGEVTLHFAAALTISNSAGNIRTKTGADITTAAGMVIKFYYDGTNWREVDRASTGGATLDGSGTATNLASWTDSDTLAASGITLASNVLTHAASSSGATVSAVVSNTSNTASSKAVHSVSVAGATANDAVYQAIVTGATTWSWGVDNSESDSWVLSQSATLGTSNRFSISTLNADGARIDAGNAVLSLNETSGARLSYATTNHVTIGNGNINLIVSGAYGMRMLFGTARVNLAMLSDGGGGFGGGDGIMSITNATTVPTTNLAGGGFFYTEAGALKYRGSAGTVTTLGVA